MTAVVPSVNVWALAFAEKSASILMHEEGKDGNIRIRELTKSYDILNVVTDLKKDLRTATAGFCANSLSLTILCNKKSLQYCAALYPP